MVEDFFTSPSYAFAALHLLKQELKVRAILVSFMELGVLVDGALQATHVPHQRLWIGLLDFGPCMLSRKRSDGEDIFIYKNGETGVHWQ